MMGILGWIVFGLVVGAVAKLFNCRSAFGELFDAIRRVLGGADAQ